MSEVKRYWVKAAQRHHVNPRMDAVEMVDADDYDRLRDENTRLTADYVKLFKLAEPIAKMLGELSILPIGCSREQELAWKMAVKNLRHYQRDNASDELQAALDGGKGVQG